MRYPLLPATCLLLLAGSASAGSAEQNRSTMNEIEEQITTMVPLAIKMQATMLEGQLQAVQRNETVAAIGAFKKKLFDDLVRRGFTRAEALQIVSNTAPPALADVNVKKQ